jgi:hypothetical protein
LEFLLENSNLLNMLPKKQPYPRLYGGIHFRDSIEDGGKQGENIGEYILKKLALK